MTTEEFIAKIPLARKAEVLAYDDNGLVAVNKGAGLLSHPNPRPRPGEKTPFVRAHYSFDREYFSWEDADCGKMRLYLVNRLDSPTSGVILAASNPECARAAKLAFREKTAKKTYYAVCKNRPPATAGMWRDTIKKISAPGHVRSAADAGGAEAVTEFKMERMDANSLGVSLMKLEPITGKTHQLRVQCARRGLPILGDATYGDFDINRRIKALTGIGRLLLHCASTSVTYSMGGNEFEFSAEAPLPESFLSIVDYNNKIFSATRGFRQ